MTIVYCRCYDDCAYLYIYLKKRDQAYFTELPGAPDVSRFCLIDKYQSCIVQVVTEDQVIQVEEE